MTSLLLGLMAFYYFYIIAIGLFLFRKRRQSVIDKRVKASYFKAYQDQVPDDLRVFENHFNNQFQMPIVFLISCTTALALKVVSPLILILSFCFVLTRMMHTYIHLTFNAVLRRATLYFAGAILLGFQWIVILMNHLNSI